MKELTNIDKMIQEEKNKKNSLKFYCNDLIIYFCTKDKSWKLKILEHSKKNLLKGGVYNPKRNCYYPTLESPKDIAEYNKLEKLFRKYGFKSL